MELTKQLLYDYLEKNNLEEDFSILKMGTDLGKLRTKFFLEVKSLTGHNPSQMVMHYRLDKAKTQLTNSNSIADVAYNVGFDSAAYFSKCFKDVFKMSPTQYIKSITNEEQTKNSTT
jgi:AraC-like DNA-binding protein